MSRRFLKLFCDVNCSSDQPLRYRAFVNEELFSERTWIWNNVYLEEMFQIHAPPGRYTIRFENVDPELGSISVSNYRVEGPGHVIEGAQPILEISL